MPGVVARRLGNRSSVADEAETPTIRCGFCGRHLHQLTIHERDTFEGKIFILACPHCHAVLAAAGLGGPQLLPQPPRP